MREGKILPLEAQDLLVPTWMLRLFGVQAGEAVFEA